MQGFVAEDHWSRNEGPVRVSERPTGGVWRACEEFRRSVKETLTGPFQANRSDGTKPGIGIERKNKPTFRGNMCINIKIYTCFFDYFYNYELTLFWVIVGINSSAIWWDEFFIYICYFILSEWQSMQKYILIWRKRQTGRKWIKYCVRFLLLGLILLLGTILLCNRIIIHST